MGLAETHGTPCPACAVDRPWVSQKSIKCGNKFAWIPPYSPQQTTAFNMPNARLWVFSWEVSKGIGDSVYVPVSHRWPCGWFLMALMSIPPEWWLDHKLSCLPGGKVNKFRYQRTITTPPMLSRLRGSLREEGCESKGETCGRIMIRTVCFPHSHLPPWWCLTLSATSNLDPWGGVPASVVHLQIHSHLTLTH